MAKVIRKLQAVANLDAAIVQLIHGGHAQSRATLARELKLVPSTAGIYVDRLIREGFLLEAATTTRTLGRPPVMIELNPEAGRFVGVDFDAQQIMAVTVDFAQQPLKQIRRTIPPKATTDRVLSIIEDAIDASIGSRRSDVLGIGLGVPGFIDAECGIARFYKFIADWRDVPIVERMARVFEVPVAVENNLRSMALAEMWMGQGRGMRNLICLGIRSGIGAGIINEGKLLRGANNLAGEVGTWTYPTSGSSHKSRTVEDLASMTAVLSEAQAMLDQGVKSTMTSAAEGLTANDLLSALATDDALATKLVKQGAEIHGWIAHQLIQLLDPERIILAGPLVASDYYLNTIQQVAAAHGSASAPTVIVRSMLGPFAGALGAAALAFQHWKPRR